MPMGPDVVDVIGQDHFRWLATQFDRRTRLEDAPEDMVRRLAAIPVGIRDYGRDPNAVTGIALLAFTYRMAGGVPEARFGTKELLLLKVLAKHELLRRAGTARSDHALWSCPLFELITGKVGEHVRAMRLIDSPNSQALDRFDKEEGL